MFAPDFVSRIFGLPSPVPSGLDQRLGCDAHPGDGALHSGAAGSGAVAVRQHHGHSWPAWMATVWLVIGGRVDLARALRPVLRAPAGRVLLPAVRSGTAEPAVIFCRDGGSCRAAAPSRAGQ